MNFLAFPSVKLRKVWQIGSKYFTSVGAWFSGKSLKPRFFAALKDTNMKKSKIFTTPSFFVFKILISLDAICCENFGRFHQRKFKKITNKAIIRVKKTHLFGNL